MNTLPTTPGLGELKTLDVLIWMDGPRLLHVANDDKEFIAELAEETPTKRIWLLVEVKPEEQKTLNDLYHDAELLYQLTEPGNRLQIRATSEIPEQWLPTSTAIYPENPVTKPSHTHRSI